MKRYRHAGLTPQRTIAPVAVAARPWRVELLYRILSRGRREVTIPEHHLDALVAQELLHGQERDAPHHKVAGESAAATHKVDLVVRAVAPHLLGRGIGARAPEISFGLKGRTNPGGSLDADT